MEKKDRDRSGSTQDPKQRSVRHKAELTNEDAAASLEAIARALREGRLVVPGEDEILGVPLPPQLAIDIKAKSSRGARKTSLDLSLKWKDRKADNRTEETSGAVPESSAEAPEQLESETPAPPSEPPASGWTPAAE